MKLSKNKIKQLLKVKNQSQKRHKKHGKKVRSVKKTVGRKKPVNLRNKTLKRGGGGAMTKPVQEQEQELELMEKPGVKIIANLLEIKPIFNELIKERNKATFTSINRVASKLKASINEYAFGEPTETYLQAYINDLTDLRETLRSNLSPVNIISILTTTIVFLKLQKQHQPRFYIFP